MSLSEITPLPSPEEVILGAVRDQTPIVLLLGQDFYSLSADVDPVLDLALQKLERPSEIREHGWPAIISNGALTDNFYEWLAERFNRRPQPTWLQNVACIPWSAIFTSALDSGLTQAFSIQSREPQAVLTSNEVPVAARSTARTPIYFLFGRAGVSDALSMPPRTRAELRARNNQQAIPMLNRLPETATALGIVIVDGFIPERDWLGLDPLLAAIEKMPPAKVIWCGWQHTQPGASDAFADIENLVGRGQIIATQSRLGTIIAELKSSGRLEDVIRPSSEDSGTVSFADGKSLTLAPGLRIRVEAVASIIDDSWTSFLPPLGLEAEYLAFRQFHGDVEGARALVNGTRYGYAVTRDFEARLWHVTKSGIEDHARLADPIVVHGQSGTGKSIALARLVVEVRKDTRAAVLYSRARIPQSADIDDFCEAAEQSGAAVTVVICDCNAPIHRYRELFVGLRSRGRRIVLVCSTYRQVDNQGRLPRTFVEAPDALSDPEREQLITILARFSGSPLNMKIGHDRSVLATLYRTLPASRQRLSSGLSSEARAAEEVLRLRGALQKRRQESALATALIAAGLATEDEKVLEERIDDALQAADDSAGHLIDFVMAAGRLNCGVPITVLLRAVATSSANIDLMTVARMFQGLDLFRWRRSEDESEELLISPRLTLEAELICRRRLINASGEGLQLVNLMRAVRLSWDAGGTERRFLLDLVQRLGPDGPLRNRYREVYLNAARALTEGRSSYGVHDPSLMLQEAVLRRSAIREGMIPDSAKLEVLEEAREAVQTAMDELATQSGRGARRARANLSVERAAIYGFLATYRAQQSASAEEVWSAYQAARAAARAAVAISDTYFALDVSLWIAVDLIEAGKLPKLRELELIADIYAVLDRVDPMSLPPEQRDRFNRRLYAIGEKLRLPEMSEEAFAAMEADGSTGGYYLRARSIGPDIAPDGPDQVDVEARRRAGVAAAFLRSYWNRIEKDERCLRYLLQCEWIAAVGWRLLRGERAPLPSLEADRATLLQLVKVLNGVIGAVKDNALYYLEAVLSWINNEEQHAHHIWRELARETDFIDPRRVIRRHVLTDANRSPIVFVGRIEAETEPGRFTVRVDGLGRRIQLLSRDFPGVELAYGRPVSPFAVAFNYIGPIATSLSRSGTHP